MKHPFIFIAIALAIISSCFGEDLTHESAAQPEGIALIESSHYISAECAVVIANNFLVG